MGWDELILLDTIEPILKDDLVNDLSANNASPSEKILAISIKLFIDHHPIAAMAPHDTSLLDRIHPQTSLGPHATGNVIPLFQHTVLSCFHKLRFYSKRRKSK
jgi:hypothetical protein